MGKWWSVLFAVMMIFCGGLFVVAPFMGWWLPLGGSTQAQPIDDLWYFIEIITGFFFVLTEAILCIFMYKYAGGREKPAAGAAPSIWVKIFSPVTRLLNDQHKVEMAWTFVPAVLLLIIAGVQVRTWANVKYVSRMPTYKENNENNVPLQTAISARQFEWRVRYPSPERYEKWLSNKDDADVVKDYTSFAKVEQLDDVHLPNELHVIQDIPVVVHLSTRDVIHSFNLPHMRVKQDALPGKIIPVWFTPTHHNTVWFERLKLYVDGVNPKKGILFDTQGNLKRDPDYFWDLSCAELCGWGHHRMVGRLYVHENEEGFLNWLKLEDKKNRARQPDKIVAP